MILTHLNKAYAGIMKIKQKFKQIIKEFGIIAILSGLTGSLTTLIIIYLKLISNWNSGDWSALFTLLLIFGTTASPIVTWLAIKSAKRDFLNQNIKMLVWKRQHKILAKIQTSCFKVYKHFDMINLKIQLLKIDNSPSKTDQISTLIYSKNKLAESIIIALHTITNFHDKESEFNQKDFLHIQTCTIPMFEILGNMNHDNKKMTPFLNIDITCDQLKKFFKKYDYYQVNYDKLN